MNETILTALITSGFALIGIVITNLSSNKNLVNKVKDENNKVINEIKLEFTEKQAITDTKLEELTREVREHNNFAKRMPVVENEIKHLKDYHK